MLTGKHSPIHPGEVLWSEFMKPLGINKSRLAQATRMPTDRVGKLVRGERRFTADTCLRLARYLGTSAEFWMNLQARHDLDAARDELGETIRAEIEPRGVA